ncbi:hypothetical protein VP01_362g15 [Puccinia sorghi]|uniref:Uncharacterized protein n=1 Tax=Puccinia sorghi TaxID=27349 RepID=A0A0L6UUR5_9BASI|nr:hypothetical protein VP01_362g15 [Puccinia sorghi]
MNPRQASLRSHTRSTAIPTKRAPSDHADPSASSKKSQPRKKPKKSADSQPACVDPTETLPSYEILTKLSEPLIYVQGMLEKQGQKGELAELDERLRSTAYWTRSPEDEGGTDAKDRLLEVVRWKILRGQFRPTLAALVSQNSPENVQRIVSKALLLLAPCRTTQQALQSDSLTILCQLKGVGPATAAAFLSFEAPTLVPVFSDEAASFFTDSLGAIKYTLSFYKKYAACIAASLERLSVVHRDAHWDLQRLERALWAFRVLRNKLPDAQWHQLFHQPTLVPASTSSVPPPI